MVKMAIAKGVLGEKSNLGGSCDRIFFEPVDCIAGA